MLIEKPGRGRPSRQYILEQLDLAMEDLERIGGLPAPLENAEIWRDIWYEEAHNSTAIEGNTLALKQVRTLLDENRPVGNKELREYLEVKAYAQAAQWVYERGRGDGRWPTGTQLIQLSEVRHVHRLAVGPVWELFPPEGLHSDEGAGSFRHHNIAPFRAGMAPPPFTDVHALMTDWLTRVNSDERGETHAMVALAEAHADFERIHPFRDGNGRTGRLVLNLMLVRQGFPPAVVRNRRRASYLTALRRADEGDPWALAEIVARAVKESLDRFLLPSLAGPLNLLPLSALTTSDLKLRALRAAADRGRLKATRDSGGRWLSTKTWVADYRRTRRVGRPRKATP